jgi:alpha-tubulin suppressor-like RCC1 family protein
MIKLFSFCVTCAFLILNVAACSYNSNDAYMLNEPNNETIFQSEEDIAILENNDGSVEIAAEDENIGETPIQNEICVLDDEILHCIDEIEESNPIEFIGEENDEIPLQSAQFATISSVVSTSGTMSFVIHSDGSLWGWGRGILGDGTELRTQNRPIKIMDDVIAVSTGGSHTMAIRTDGSLWAWGSNTVGQLGDGTTENQLYPIKIMDEVIAVSTATGHTMVIKSDSSLWAWGWNSNGQIGDGATINRHSPIKIMDDVMAISASVGRSMAITRDESLWAWGYDRFENYATANRLIPDRIMEGVISVSSGYEYTMVIRSDGSLWGWGRIGINQLEDGASVHQISSSINNPIKIMEDVVAVSAGWFHAMVIRSDGSLWAWGDNRSGQLGNGTRTYERIIHLPIDGGTSIPSNVMNNVIFVVASGGKEGGMLWGHTLAITSDGNLWAWGDNRYGQLGDGESGRRLRDWGGMDMTDVFVGDEYENITYPHPMLIMEDIMLSTNN